MTRIRQLFGKPGFASRWIRALLCLVGVLGAGEMARATETADFAVRVDVDRPAVRLGRDVAYRVTVSNAGPETVIHARVEAGRDPGVSGVQWTCNPVGFAFCAFRGSGAIDQRVALTPGASVVFSVTGTVSPDAKGEILHTARVTLPPGVTDPDPSNNTAQGRTEVLPVITALKGVGGSFVEGGVVVYTVTLTNHTETTQPDNPGPELFDPLPPEVIPLGLDADSGSGRIDLAENTVLWDGIIPGGATVGLRIHTRIAPGTAGALVVNQGEVHFALAGDASNDAVALTEAPTGGPTVFQVLELAAIPSLGGIGMGLLALLLAVAALGRLRRSIRRPDRSDAGLRSR